MKDYIKILFLCLFILNCILLSAQKPKTSEAKSIFEETVELPNDDFVKRSISKDRKPMAYQPIRESDLYWEKRIWRVIDVREKMNLPFAYPEQPLFNVLSNAAVRGDLAAYSVENDRFTKRLSVDELIAMLTKIDTVVTFDPETYEEKLQVVRNDINWEDVKRFRIKEVWFFDKETSQMHVRILGIAPLINIKDSEGNFRYEQPMFWVYYPEVRDLLSKKRVPVNGMNTFYAGDPDAENWGWGNYNTLITWEDIFEMRLFSSYIYKESNVHDRRLEEYLSGTDLLLESDRIRNELLGNEHNLWQY